MFKSGRIRDVTGGYEQGCEKIVVAGMEKGVGATHFSILMANYYAEVLHKKTAVIDCGNDNDYFCLKEMVTFPNSQKRQIQNYGIRKAVAKDCEKRWKPDGFKLGKVFYFLHVPRQNMDEIFLKKFECIIMDLGNNYRKYKYEAGMCEKRFLMATVCPWKLDVFVQSYQEYFEMYSKDEWNYVFSFGDDESVEYLRKTLKIKFQRLPIIPDPFQIEREQLDAVKKIIWEESVR